MSKKLIEMTGKRYGRLLVLGLGERHGTSYLWRCVCDCGNAVQKQGGTLRRSTTLSCGCGRNEKLVSRNRSNGKGYAASGAYKVYWGMLHRCHKPSNSNYKNYGAKGVRVCQRWREGFGNFLTDMGPRPPGMTLDRIDVFGDYCPENCRWATNLVQLNNRRNVRKFDFQGSRVSLSEACRITGIKYQTARARMQRGWTFDRAVQETLRGADN